MNSAGKQLPDVKIQEEIELSAVLNLIPYMDKDFMTDDSPVTLNEIIERYEKEFSSPDISKEYRDQFKLLKEAVQANESWGKIELVNQSNIEAPGHTPDGDPVTDLTQGCTFRDADGNYYVAFRGTGAGRWEDNGDGMTEESTLMQEASRQYFDEMAKTYFEEAYLAGKEVIVTGHSKGGNEAQYVYMTSDYEYLISRCYNLDGQGFSQAARDSFKERYGADYQEKLNNMYSVCGQNDFVHDLGFTIIPDEHTYFVRTSGSGIASYHMLENMISDDDMNYRRLTWTDEKGELFEQGPVGEFAKKLSENMMKMDEADLHGCALAVMAIVDRAMNGKLETIGDVKADGADYLDLIGDGLPAILKTLFLTEEGHELLGMLITAGVEEAVKKWGPAGAAGVIAGVFLIAAAVLPSVIKLGAKLWLVLKFADTVVDIAERIVQFTKDLARFVSEVKEAFLSTVDRIFNGIGDFFAGRTPAAVTNRIEVDTELLRDYAERLRAVNNRLSGLDSRIDSLYLKVGLTGLWKLLSADFRIGYSRRLELCASYLSDTAQDFILCENEILRHI